MSIYRHKNPNRQRSRDLIDRKVDQWVETGRQLVDGVSGNRPGQRKSGRPVSSRLDNLGRWVEDKIDWFFEDEEDWMEPFEDENSVSGYPSQKRPLEAISLRTTKALGPAIPNKSNHFEDDWPDEDSFRVNRWERTSSVESRDTEKLIKTPKNQTSRAQRPLPRSSRRRSGFD